MINELLYFILVTRELLNVQLHNKKNYWIHYSHIVHSHSKIIRVQKRRSADMSMHQKIWYTTYHLCAKSLTEYVMWQSVNELKSHGCTKLDMFFILDMLKVKKKSSDCLTWPCQRVFVKIKQRFYWYVCLLNHFSMIIIITLLVHRS